MAPPSLAKRDFSQLWRWRLGGEPLYFLAFVILVPTASTLSLAQLQTDPVPTSQPEDPDPTINLSLHPHEGKICVLFSFCQMGHFGNKNCSRVWAWLGWWKEHCLFGVCSQSSFAWESLGEPSNFQVVASGSQQTPRTAGSHLRENDQNS